MKLNYNPLIKKHSKSFYWASFFLTKKCYMKCAYLYDFCRTLDDIVDSRENIEKKHKLFLKFKQDFKQKKISNPIIKNMWFIIQNSKINLKVVDDLFNGIESDLENPRILRGFDDIYFYAYQVAGTVGLMMAKILNVSHKSAAQGALELGIAMQLTNIARDVNKDLQLGRMYIRHDFDIICETIKKADQFYDSAFNSIKFIPIKNRFAILVARRIYREIGYKILKLKNIQEYDLEKRVYVTKWTKFKLTCLSVGDFIFILVHQLIKQSKKKPNQGLFCLNYLDARL